MSSFSLKSINAKNASIKGSPSETFLGVTGDSKFLFEKHANGLCKKSNQKLHALARCAKYMSTEKILTLFKTSVVYQFRHYLLVWMLHTKDLNNCINK